MCRLKCSCFTVLVLFALPALAVAQESAADTPADGHTIHVTAPHIMGDHLIDPMHHYCKVISPEPVIQCLMFASTEPDARLMGIEYIAAKSITRNEVPLGDWNTLWHDHAVEIEAGVVALPDMPEEEAAEVANVVAGTDGIVFITWPEDWTLPTGDVLMAQAITHEIMTPDEYTAPLRELRGPE